MIKISHRLLLVIFFTLMVGARMGVAQPINPADLIKVTPGNNPNCVEYYNYQNTMYCSTKPLQNEPVDPNISSYEKQHIVFDQRAWRAAWSKHTPSITTVEYVPAGESINQWHELITSQFIPDIQNKVTPWEFAQTAIQGLKDNGIGADINIIEHSPEQLIYEMKIAAPENLKQDEIQIIRKGKDGFYILHYAIKEADMGEKNRTYWLNNLKKSSIK